MSGWIKLEKDRRDDPQCPRCGGKTFVSKYTGKPYVCGTCDRSRVAQRSRAAARAARAVLRARRDGVLATLPDGRQCTDCDREAEVWDHRDYSKPLSVEPVCLSCNKLRGPALGSGALLPYPRVGGAA